ncbi:AMP-binding protein [Gordonia rubripertincta]|uniref:AMP-binding protein n=1 Tax=Gordonia rubripertincta TaxID=36822 RepID=A0ABT4MZ12_GORRU|nr:AMP-binding protein [Gordonia rubripertincta]MCZ4551461.1 AMP-binding protein [Gordonia rubripertincta]
MSWYTVARHEPSTPAIVDGTQTLTFGQLRSVVARITAGFDKMGVAAGHTVAVVLPNCWELLAIELAALSTERYFLPINHHLTADEIAYILGNSAPSVVVTNNELLDVVEAAAGQVTDSAFDHVQTTGPGVHAFDRVWAHLPDRDPEVRRAGSVVYYSSGTTGRPKGIRRPLSGTTPEQESDASQVAWAKLQVAPGPGVHVAVAPLYHAAPNGMALGALGRGVTVVIAPGKRFDAARFLSLADEVGMTESFMVPTMFVRLLQLPPAQREAFDPSLLRCVVHAGAPCPISVKQHMISWWGPIVSEFYGSTESSVTTTVTSAEWLDAPGTVGGARPGCRIEIHDRQGSVLPPGDEGLICIIGSQPFEYIGDPGKTQESWVDGGLVLGDIGRLDEAGRLFVLDRRSDLILTGGVNVYPAEIELALSNHPQVQDIVVIGMPDDEWGQRVLALVQPAEGVDRNALAEDLAAYASPILAKFKQPREYRIVDEIPRMPTGKVNRTAIRERQIDSGQA